jgi:hypothetical protein
VSWTPAPAGPIRAMVPLTTKPQLIALDGGGFTSPMGRQWIDCTGCLPQLTTLQQQLNVKAGLGYFDGGAYVPTPSPSYYLDGAIALLPDGGYLAPTIDESIPEPNPVVPNEYRFTVLDQDQPTVVALLDAGVVDAALALAPVLSVTWYSTLLSDGGVLLPDGGVTSVTALTDGGAGVDSGVTLQDGGIHIEAGGSMSLGDH